MNRNEMLFRKMCKEAIEVQRLHLPKMGDEYICACYSCEERHLSSFIIHNYDIDCLNGRDLNNIYPPYAKMVRDSDVGGFVAYYNERNKNNLSYIWLPSQEDLQNMFDLKYADSHYRLLRECQEFSISEYGNYFYNMKQIWLAFLMKEKFNKIWNYEKQDWKVI